MHKIHNTEGLVLAKRGVGEANVRVVLLTTNICNARCAFCAYPQMKRPKATMTLELFRSAVDQYLALGEADVDLTPIVGEPAGGQASLRTPGLSARPCGAAALPFLHQRHPPEPEQGERLLGYGERFRLFCSLAAFDRESYREVMGVDRFDEVVANLRGLIEAKARTGSAIGLQICLRTAAGAPQGDLWDFLQRMRDARRHHSGDGISHFDNWGGPLASRTCSAPAASPSPPLCITARATVC